MNKRVERPYSIIYLLAKSVVNCEFRVVRPFSFFNGVIFFIDGVSGVIGGLNGVIESRLVVIVPAGHTGKT